MSEGTTLGNSVTPTGHEFAPFYDPWGHDTPISISVKITLSLLLGLIFLGVHSLRIGSQVFADWSWFLSIVITSAMLCLYYATHTLRTIFPEMDLRLKPGGNQIYMSPLTTILFASWSRITSMMAATASSLAVLSSGTGVDAMGWGVGTGGGGGASQPISPTIQATPYTTVVRMAERSLFIISHPSIPASG